VIEEVQDLGLAGAAGQGLNVQKRHGRILWGDRHASKAAELGIVTASFWTVIDAIMEEIDDQLRIHH
jgi:hypothetical protein